MEDDSLESLITNNPDGPLTVVSSAHEIGNAPEVNQAFRPKLRKIKRPKIRPMSDIPAAPEKITPQTEARIENNEMSQSVIQTNPTSESDGVSPFATGRETVMTDFSDTKEQEGSFTHQQSARELSASTNVETGNDMVDVLVDDLQQELKQSTEIVKIAGTSDLASGEGYNSSYVLDSLPPELDYDPEEYIENSYADSGSFVKKKFLFLASGLCLVVGLFAGKAMFSSQTVENYGLEGVVTNPDVPSGRPRCGLTDKSQACVFYLMNWYKQELNGRDFYKLAAQLTGREEYMIETDNLRYATVKIKPGHFAQLNIPALK